MNKIFFLLFFLPIAVLAQEPTFKKGIPDDLDKEKIIFLKHEPIKVTARKKSKKAEKYLYERQTNHNKVIEESNQILKGAALAYPFEYAITTPSTYISLAKAGYKYVLQSSVYKYDHLQDQPTEDELVVFTYFIYDMENNIAYEVFHLDEMKVYDFKLIIKRLKRAIKAAK